MNLGTFILASTAILIEFYACKYREEDFARTLQELEADLGVPRIRTYDFIVVGGGTAGCVVAGLLSEHFSVLLLEAGGSPPPATDVPAYVNEVHWHPDINDVFSMVPLQHGAGRSIASTMGRMLGGSGSHNHNIHNRGSPYDFDHWANLTGDPSWGYESVLEYFKRSEDFIGVLFDNDEGAEENYGHGGPMPVDTYVNPFVVPWFEAARELGYDVGDPNGRQRESFNAIHMTEFGGQKISTYKRYVKPFEGAGARTNLTVLRYSEVQEILLDDQNRAFGVAYNRHRIAQRAHASKEVIISAGTFRSPLLLMKSGIGPADVLEGAGIPIRVERAGVGLNLCDHPAVTIAPLLIEDTSLLPRITDGDEAELERWHESGTGLIGHTDVGAQAFLVSSVAKAAGEGDWPDILMNTDMIPVGYAPPADGSPDSFSFSVGSMRSKSRGSVRLNGTAWRGGERDDRGLAVVDAALLADPNDLAIMVEAIKIGLRVFENTTVFQRVGVRYPDTPLEGCLDVPYRSDEYWRCFITNVTWGWQHPVGTNRMGRPDDQFAVLDSKLRVIGVEGLRVIDASAMPAATNANPNAPTIMLAEKGAAEILLAHGVA